MSVYKSGGPLICNATAQQASVPVHEGQTADISVTVVLCARPNMTYGKQKKKPLVSWDTLRPKSGMLLHFVFISRV